MWAKGLLCLVFFRDYFRFLLHTLLVGRALLEAFITEDGTAVFGLEGNVGKAE